MSLAISMVALGKDAKISGTAIPKAWAARWRQGAQPGGAEKKENTLSYRVGEIDVIYGLMPAPIPWSDLERPCETSILWPEAAAELKRHKRHVIVTASGEAEPVELMTVLTQATAALADSCEGTVGVYWGSASIVLPPKLFGEIAGDCIPNEFPVAIWVNCVVGKNEDGGSSGYTCGLDSFGLMDFVAEKSPEPPAELHKRLFGFAEYILTNGPVIKDGDTIGETAEEKIKITYGPSTFGHKEPVMRLSYPVEFSGKSSGERLTTYGYLHAGATLLCTIGFGYFLYTVFPFLRESFLRHVVLIPLILIFGFLLLLISDNILQKAFGLQAFDKPKD